ncbi:MAG: MFS transporter [bacterium]
MQVQSNIKILKWFNFFSEFKLYLPIAIIYFSQVTGSFTLGMSIFSLVMISSAVFEIPTGVFSDRIGRRKTVIWGAFAAVLCGSFYAIGQSFWILAIGTIFEGLSRSFYSGNNDALLHDTLTQSKNKQQYSEFLGKVSTTLQIAGGLSAVLGGILATKSLPIIMWLSVIPQIVCVVLAFKLIEPKIHTNNCENVYLHLKEAYEKFLHNKKLRLLSLSSMIGSGFGDASYKFVPAFYNTLWPVWAIGIVGTLSNIAGALSFHFSGKLIRKFGALKLLFTDYIFNRMANIVAAAFPTFLSPLLMSATSVSFGVATVAKSTLMQQEFADEERATMGSLNSLAGSILFGLVSILLGFTADLLSPAKAILLLQTVLLVNFFIYWKLFKHDIKYCVV